MPHKVIIVSYSGVGCGQSKRHPVALDPGPQDAHGCEPSFLVFKATHQLALAQELPGRKMQGPRMMVGAAATLSVLLAVGDATVHVGGDVRGGKLAGFVPALSLRGYHSASESLSARCARRNRYPLATATAAAENEQQTTPAGTVDPFQSVLPDMRRLKRKIKSVIDKKLGSGDDAHPALKSSSREFFERNEKTWRPMIALLLSRVFDGTSLEAADPAHHDDAMVIAEIVEIMHTSTVIHDTVLEDYEAFEKGNMAHRIYSSSIAGNKISILAGDFLLSRASVLLSSLRNTDVVEIMAGALESIMMAQMQLHRPTDDAPVGMDAYVSNLRTRTGNLLASGCQCAAMMAGHTKDSKEAIAAFEYGMNVGVAYQLVKDLQITEANYEKVYMCLCAHALVFLV